MKKTKTQVKYEKLVVDESISTAQLDACIKWLKDRGTDWGSTLHVSENDAGMPDHRIVEKLLTKNDALLTADRPFHNGLLQNGFQSLYIDTALTITQRPIAGIQPAKLYVGSNGREVRVSMSGLHDLIMPESAKAQAKLRTKRRRIRAHFGGYDQLTQLSITLAARKNLIGVRLNVAGATAKGITASESYIGENILPPGRAAHSHALILSLQLMLHELDVSVYYDPATIHDPEQIDDPFFLALQKEFRRLKYIACSKGRHMESHWQKLQALQSSKTNEIVASRLEAIERFFLTLPGIDESLAPVLFADENQ